MFKLKKNRKSYILLSKEARKEGSALDYHFYSYFRKIRTTQERREWFRTKDAMKQVGLVNRNRRSYATLPCNYEDIQNVSACHHRLSWKAHTKCKKAWMKNLNR